MGGSNGRTYTDFTPITAIDYTYTGNISGAGTSSKNRKWNINYDLSCDSSILNYDMTKLLTVDFIKVSTMITVTGYWAETSYSAVPIAFTTTADYTDTVSTSTSSGIIYTLGNPISYYMFNNLTTTNSTQTASYDWYLKPIPMSDDSGYMYLCTLKSGVSDYSDFIYSASSGPLRLLNSASTKHILTLQNASTKSLTITQLRFKVVFYLP